MTTSKRKELEIQNIPISQLKISEFNVRKHITDVSELSKSIEEKGILQPLVVRPESNGKVEYGIIIGSRRFAAAKEANLKELPVTIHDDIDDNEALTISLIENLQRNDLQPKETSTALAELLNQGFSTRELGIKIGKSNKYVSEMASSVTLCNTLEKHGIKTEMYAKDVERKKGKAIPVQHVIYESQAVNRVEKEKGKGYVSEDRQVEFAKEIAAKTQDVTEKAAELFIQDPDQDIHQMVLDAEIAVNLPEGHEHIGSWNNPETERTELTKMGNIRDACRQLWTALTDKQNMPHKDEDLIVDHIKPTREYRKFVYGLTKDNLHGLHDWLSYTIVAAQDMLETIEEADKKASD